MESLRNLSISIVFILIGISRIYGQTLAGVQIVPSNPNNTTLTYAIIYTSMPSTPCWVNGYNFSGTTNDHFINSYYCSTGMQTGCYQIDTLILGILSPGQHHLLYSMYAGVVDSIGNCQNQTLVDTAHISFSVGNNGGSLFVNVNPQAEMHICDGDSMHLNGDFMAGATYQWYFNGDIIPGATEEEYFAKDSGFYYLKLHFNGDSGVSNALLVNVHRRPEPFLSQIGYIVYSNATGINHQWFTLETGILNGEISYSIVVGSTGNYFVEVMNSSMCLGRSDTLYVELINPILQPDSLSELCNYDTMYISVIPADTLHTYQWLKNGTILVNETNSTLRITHAGNYQSIVAVSQSVDTTAVSTVNLLPNPIPQILREDWTLTCSEASSYQWYSISSGMINGAINQVYQVETPGYYYVKVTYQNGCTSASNAIDVFPAGAEFHGKIGTISAKYELGIMQIQLNISDFNVISLFSLDGSLIFSESFTADTYFKSIPLGSGVYFAQISGSQSSSTLKILVQ